MASPELGEVARNLAVMVRVRGPDPKGLKMRGHAFHHYSDGQTTLSASGMLLPETLSDVSAVERLLGASYQAYGLVITVASVIEPFLTLQHRRGISQQTPPGLITGAQIEVLFEGKMPSNEKDTDAPHWIGARLLKLVNVPVTACFQSLIQATSMDTGWKMGWSLASYDNSSPLFVNHNKKQVENNIKGSSSMPDMQENLPGVQKKNTSIAILAVSLPSKNIPRVKFSTSYKRGDFILAAGSPFGILSPLHFLNSLSKGSIANCYHSRFSDISLLLADIRCLPGMEGGPIFSEFSELIGILIRPLRQRFSGAEIQLVIPWKAIAIAEGDLLRKEHNFCRQEVKETEISNTSDFDRPLPVLHTNSKLPIENILPSICLITINEGAWASGILLNDHGLILTNAHLLEPWRFGKVTMVDGKRITGSEFLSCPPDSSVLPKGNECENSHQSCHPLERKKGSKVAPRQNLRKIRVRLDHVEPWIWVDAKVKYISQGPLDIALLQVEYVPLKLVPIEADFACPSPGLLAYVVGHGLFGPKCAFYPSVCTGVVSKVVNAKCPLYLETSQQPDKTVPVMLETTASVHPGSSGGAVINSSGHMIGLVTSNSKHGGGTVIPHLNFSIPCAVLTPVFEYAKDMQNMSLLEALDQSNEELSLIWALMASVPPKNDPYPPPETGDMNKQEKGTKFAKFIAERNDLSKYKLDGSHEIIPCKL